MKAADGGGFAWGSCEPALWGLYREIRGRGATGAPSLWRIRAEFRDGLHGVPTRASVKSQLGKAARYSLARRGVRGGPNQSLERRQ